MTAAIVVAAIAAVLLGLQRRRNTFLRSDLDARSRMLDAVEERLADARADVFRFVTAIESVSQGVVVWDERGREVLRNEAASGFTGGRHDAIVEQAVVDELTRGRSGLSGQRVLELFGPPPRTLVITTAPIGRGGAVAIIDDASERRRVESMRRDFVANISHELKTPIGALGALADTIADETDPDVVRRLASRMADEVARVGNTIDDLLTLAELESDAGLARERLQLAGVVQEALARVRSVIDDRRIDVEIEEVDASHVVDGDRRQLVSAVANLVDNACKYGDEESTVVLRSRAVDSWVELDVEDRGVGIPSRDLDRIFERFYRVDRARSRRTGGTGLGLAIVRHVAVNHDGEVTVRSTEGAGSTFTLRLPAATTT